MTQPPALYTAHDIPDLLNALPTFFGFRPTESLVGVATTGPRRRFGFRLRVDIPEPQHVDALARVVVGHLRAQGADGAVLLAVTERQDVARDLLAACERELDEIQVIVAARADGRRYWSDEPGFPLAGIPYETSDHHVSIVQAVAAGQQILPDRAALVARFAPVSGERATWLGHATRELLDQIVPVVAGAPAGTLGDVGMRELQPILDRARAGEVIDDGDLLRVSVWVSSVPVRDEVWSQITRDTAPALLDLLVRVAGAVVPPFEPAVLTLAAFAAWLSGDGAQALIAVERALAADPEYSMARLMLQMIDDGINPAVWDGLEARGVA
ncbi:MAG: hypothetical protein JWP31_913 [Aeromicrobium sp.]|nr:hypothetical protein [Aeromicrobium sp.]